MVTADHHSVPDRPDTAAAPELAAAERWMRTDLNCVERDHDAESEVLDELDRLRAALAERDTEIERLRTLLDKAHAALRAVGKAALVVKTTLNQPYPDAPDHTPWSRFMEEPARRAYNLAFEIRAALSGSADARAHDWTDVDPSTDQTKIRAWLAPIFSDALADIADAVGLPDDTDDVRVIVDRVRRLAAADTPTAEGLSLQPKQRQTPTTEEPAQDPDEEPCPDCGDDPARPDSHQDGCRRIDTCGQFGPPWQPGPFHPMPTEGWQEWLREHRETCYPAAANTPTTEEPS